MKCDCGHEYLAHAMRNKNGVYCGGLKCTEDKCKCRVFENDATRIIKSTKVKA